MNQISSLTITHIMNILHSYYFSDKYKGKRKAFIVDMEKIFFMGEFQIIGKQFNDYAVSDLLKIRMGWWW